MKGKKHISSGQKIFGPKYLKWHFLEMYSTTYLKEISEYFQNQFIVPIHSDIQNRHLFIETKSEKIDWS